MAVMVTKLLVLKNGILNIAKAWGIERDKHGYAIIHFSERPNGVMIGLPETDEGEPIGGDYNGVSDEDWEWIKRLFLGQTSHSQVVLDIYEMN